MRMQTGRADMHVGPVSVTSVQIVRLAVKRTSVPGDEYLDGGEAAATTVHPQFVHGRSPVPGAEPRASAR